MGHHGPQHDGQRNNPADAKKSAKDTSLTSWPTAPSTPGAFYNAHGASKARGAARQKLAKRVPNGPSLAAKPCAKLAPPAIARCRPWQWSNPAPYTDIVPWGNFRVPTFATTSNANTHDQGRRRQRQLGHDAVNLPRPFKRAGADFCPGMCINATKIRAASAFSNESIQPLSSPATPRRRAARHSHASASRSSGVQLTALPHRTGLCVGYLCTGRRSRVAAG